MNIMLVLRNIKRTDRVISADYYPEDEIEFGCIEVDLCSREIIFLKKAKGYEHSSDPLHAKKELLRLAKSEKLPEEKIVLWY